MYQLGYSLDNLSLMALTLCVGFVVDDAIVMLENIVRHMEMGKSPMRAAFDGSQEVAFTIVSMTLSLTAVFIPVLFMGGVVGRLLHEFAVTISVAILVSGFVSISLTPMLCSRFLKPPHSQKHGVLLQRDRADVRRLAAAVRLDAAPDAALPRGDDGGLRRSRSSRRAISSRSCRRASCRARTRAGSTSTPKAIQGIGFAEMVRHQQQVADIVGQGSERPRVHEQRRVRPGANGSNQGSMNIELKPRAERKLSVDQIIAGAAAEAVAGAGHARVHEQPAADQHRRPRRPRARTSSRCRTPTPTSCTTGRRCSKRRCATCPASRTSTATCSSRTRRSPSTWTATRSRRSA